MHETKDDPPMADKDHWRIFRKPPCKGQSQNNREFWLIRNKK